VTSPAITGTKWPLLHPFGSGSASTDGQSKSANMDTLNPSLKFLPSISLRPVRRLLIAISLVLGTLCGSAFSQQTSSLLDDTAELEGGGFATPATQPQALPAAPSHRFWDRENRILFASVASSSAADFAVTYSNLQNGGKELNPVTRVFAGSTATLALNFVGETAGVVGVSYIFHRTGHHRLERLTPIVDACASGAAVTYGLTHHR
jgi:hypothetical protein